jgi:hypothetical protein
VLDALHLDTLGETFDTILDSGLFHVFDDTARSHYVTRVGGSRYSTPTASTSTRASAPPPPPPPPGWPSSDLGLGPSDYLLPER